MEDWKKLFQKPLLNVQAFENGQSNPTYLLTFEDERVVLRKQPEGKIIEKTAHNLQREVQVLVDFHFISSWHWRNIFLFQKL